LRRRSGLALQQHQTPNLRGAIANLRTIGFPNGRHLLADVTAIIGSFDIVFGEIDR
jgi:NADH:ubiquinone oxidoreductase subunit D